jgi:hypothetical protein
MLCARARCKASCVVFTKRHLESWRFLLPQVVTIMVKIVQQRWQLALYPRNQLEFMPQMAVADRRKGHKD